MEYQEAVTRDGCAIVPGVIDESLADSLAAAADEAWNTVTRRHAGVRNLFREAPAFAALDLAPTVRALVEPVLGSGAFVARSILFDKRPEANWDVPWHQDKLIAVPERLDVPGFGPWSIKEGVHHVQPPAEVLHGVLTVRIHLDDCGPDNGPLLTIPGTQTRFMSDPDNDATNWDEHESRRVLTARRGDAVVMRPLVMHASKKAAAPSRRRVVHLEFAAAALPGGLEWARDIG